MRNPHFPMVFLWFSHGFPMLRTPGPPLRGVVDEDPQRRAQQRRLVLRSVGGGRQGVGAALARVISWENMVISTRNIQGGAP